MKLKALLLAFVISSSLTAATIFTTVSSFMAQTGPNTVATFDDVAAGTAAPFNSAGAGFSSTPLSGVMNNWWVNRTLFGLALRSRRPIFLERSGLQCHAASQRERFWSVDGVFRM
jgi:hypothetical protein